MSTDCSLAVEDRFGPVVDGCKTNFDFTLLFEEAILFIGPLCLAYFLAVPLIWHLYQRRPIVRWGLLLPSKLYAWAFVLASQIAFVTIAAVEGPQTRATIAAGSIGIPALGGLAWLSYLQHRCAVQTSTLLVLYLLFTIPMDALRVRTLLSMLQSRNMAITVITLASTKFYALLHEVWWKSSLVLEEYKCEAPEETHGIIERALEFRMGPIFRTGYRKPLQMDDLFKIADFVSFGRLGATVASEGVDAKVPRTVSGQMLYLHARDLLDPVFPRLCLLALTFAQPFLVRRALQHLTETENVNTSKEGGALVAAYVLVYFGIAVTSSIYEQKASRATSVIRADLALIIYQHSLRLDRTAMTKDSGATMITADVERVQQGFRKLHDAWGPLASVGIGLWLVETQLGYSSLVTLGLIVGSLALSGYWSTLASKFQKTWMDAIEKRLHKTVQTLKGISGIKQLGASQSIADILNAERTSEVGLSKPFRMQLIAIVTLSFASLTMLPALGFGLHVATTHGRDNQLLNAEIAFSALTLFQIVSSGIQEGSAHIMGLLVAFGSLQRVDQFLASTTWHDSRKSLKDGESAPSTASNDSGFCEKGDDELAIKLDEVCAKWTSEGETIIKDATIKVPLHGLTVVAGPSGSGKSTLLRLMLGDMSPTSGTVSVRSKYIGFCDQTPWIANVSIQDNIVGAFAFDKSHYQYCLESCALDRDLQDLADGDRHLCGLNGASLSGGQRVRLALARAMYSRAEMILLDDCLIGLDTKTERQILDRIFGPDGALTASPMTCILATSSPKYLTMADTVISIDNEGRVSQEQGDASALLPVTHPDHVILDNTMEKVVSRKESKPEKEADKKLWEAPDKDANDFYASKHTTSSDTQVYKWYFGHVGFGNFLIFTVFCSLFVLGATYPQVWLREWTQKSPAAQHKTKPEFYGVYFGVGSMAFVAFAAACLYLFLRMAIRGAFIFHRLLVSTMLNAPMRFFATTDTGVTLNRFAQDLSIIDMELPLAFVGTMMNTLMLIAQCVVVIVQTPWAGLAVLGMAIMIGILHHAYLRSSRRLRLLDIEAKAPILSLLLEALGGLSTVRSLGWTHWYLQKGMEALGSSQLPFHLLQTAQATLNLALDIFVAILAVVVISIAVASRNTNASSLGLALLNIVGLGISVKGVVYFWTSLEITLGAVARIRDFTLDTDSENNADTVPDADWPSKGEITFQSITVSHSPSLPPAILDLTLNIKSGEKVAICGRTGSGKSTLLNSLLQLLDLSAGGIFIDGVNLASLAREDVRSRFVTLPQETLGLHVTVREYARINHVTASDDVIINGLREIGLWDAIEQHGGLDMVLNGDNLSHTQRRLLSVAVTCLRRGKILLMDEPTGHLDEHIQTYLQRAVNDTFASSTVVCVTHHLQFVLDFDTVVVMDSGVIAERGNPRELLVKSDSRFALLYASQLSHAGEDSEKL